METPRPRESLGFHSLEAPVPLSLLVPFRPPHLSPLGLRLVFNQAALLSPLAASLL